MKNKLMLKELSSSYTESLGYSLQTWHPNSREDIFFTIDIEIGTSDDDGINYFYALIATPEGLIKYGQKPCLVKNRTIVISDYSYEIVQKIINKIIDECNRNTWEESYKVLQRYFD